MKNQFFKIVMAFAIVLLSNVNSYSQEGELQNGPDIQPLCNPNFTHEPCMNLVLNPSFTIYLPGTSPYWDSFHNISGACPWTTAIKTNLAETHTSDFHKGTPNVLHQSINYSSNSVPNNHFGSSSDEIPNSVCGEDDAYYEISQSSVQAYAGIYGFASLLNNSNGVLGSSVDYREYIQQKMAAPLTAGKTYTVSLRIKLSTNSNRAVPLSVLFSSSRPNLPIPPTQANSTGVLSSAGGTLLTILPVTNKTAWQTITFSYTHAGAAAQYISIGNFKTDAQLSASGELISVSPSSSTGGQVFSYYYIDDIAVFETGQTCCQSSSNPGYSPCAYPSISNLKPIISGSNSGCTANTYSISNAGQFPAGTVFTWTFTNPGGAVVSGSGLSFSLTALQTAAGGTISLTATPPYGCPQTQLLSLTSCCSSPTGNTPSSYTATGVSGSNKASDMLAHFGGAVPQGASIYINGNFDIDVNLIWIQVTAAFGENAKINMQNGRTFTAAKNSHLFACDKMWQGIEADHPTEMIHIMDSKVEDAYRAVSSLNGGNFSLSGTTFNRNENHVGVFNFAGTHPGTISNCTFTCEDANGSMAFLNAPMNTSRTAFGIIAWNVNTLNIGTDLNLNTTGNNFRFANTHVYAIVSGVNVKKSNFSKMINWQAPTLGAGGQLNVVNGVAICAYGTTGNSNQQLNVGGLGLGEQCSFDGSWPGNNRRGAGIVSTNNIHVNVLGNAFSNLKYGVAVNKLPGFTTVSGSSVIQNLINVTVNNNQFDRIDSSAIYGVDFQRANVSASSNVFSNIFHKGIYFGNVFPVKNFTSYLIQNNDVLGDSWTAGIHTINCNRTRILNNHVGVSAHTTSWFVLNPRTHYGIRTEGCANVQIINNKIDLDNTTPTAAVFNNSTYLKLQGINVAACPGATVCNNEMQTLGAGMRFMLNNAGIRIRLNKMFSLHTGINLYHANIQNPGISTQGDDKASDNQWNNILGGNTTRRIVGNYSASFDYKYRSQSLPSQSSVPAGNWNPQNITGLIPYVQGVTFTKTVNNSTQFVTCTGQSVASMEELSQMRQAMFGDIVDGTMQYEAETEEALKYFDEKTAYTELKYDSALWAGSLQADDKFRNFVEVKETENIGRMGDVFTHVLNADKAAALQVLATINPATDVEGYEKTVADIYIRRWMNDTASFDSTEIEQLGLIANMDYETGGPAVLAARVLLGGDALDFETKSQTIADDFTEAEEPLIQIYPNPVSDVVGFRMIGEPEAFTFRLFTMQGMVVLERQMKEGELHTGIGVHHLMKGVYFYEIQTQSGKLQNGKLILITN